MPPKFIDQVWMPRRPMHRANGRKHAYRVLVELPACDDGTAAVRERVNDNGVGRDDKTGCLWIGLWGVSDAGVRKRGRRHGFPEPGLNWRIGRIDDRGARNHHVSYRENSKI